MARAEGGRSWAWAAPVLCALHCAAAPLLVGLLPSLALTSTAEWVLMGGSVILATAVVGSGMRTHRTWGIPAVAAFGFVVWTLSLSHMFAPVPEVATTVVGAFLVAGALLWNARAIAGARGSSCACESCEPEPAAVPRGSATRTPPATPKGRAATEAA